MYEKVFWVRFNSMRNLSCQLQKSIFSIKFYAVPYVECNAYATKNNFALLSFVKMGHSQTILKKFDYFDSFSLEN